jgi:shikimate kinase
MKVFLIGFMGVGKTTKGIKWAKHIDLPFYDLDLVIEKKYEQSINQLFDNLGEERFREIERDTLQSLRELESAIISVGGGTPCFHDNLDEMKRQGTLIYLELPSHAIVNRLMQDDNIAKRPLLQNKTPDEIKAYIEGKLKEREPFYKQAHVCVNSNEATPQKLTELLLGLQKN